MTILYWRDWKVKKIEPNLPADKNIIARRVALDLTGLPPDQELLQSFEKGDLTYESLVDTLLAQETYGEKWATWWLDLARYADSKGYEKDMAREIWQYRDWVIKSFNKDRPMINSPLNNWRATFCHNLRPIN